MSAVPKPPLFLVRRATAVDADAIWKVPVDSIRVVCAVDYTAEQVEAWAGKKQPKDYVEGMEKGEIMFVAEAQEQIVGFASMSGDEVHDLYVAPPMLRRGIGQTLLAALEREFANRGTLKIRLFSTLTAERFYCAQGFGVSRRTVCRMNGVDVPCIEMSKDLLSA